MATTKERLDWAFKNRGKNPAADEYVKRYKDGLLNPELTKDGMQPVPITKPRFDFSKVNLQKPTLGQEIKDASGDVLQTAQNIGTTISEGAQSIQDLAGNKDLNLAQKSMGILGSLMGTGAKTIGDVTMGVGKVALTQDAEDQLKSFVEEKTQGLADTEVVKKVADWYGNLTPENKLIVDSAGGFASLVSEIVGAGTAGKVATPVKEGLETAADTAVDLTKRGIDQTSDTVSDLFKTSQKSLENKVQSSFEKGVKPNLQGYKTLSEAEKYRESIVEGAKVITNNKNSLQFLDDAGQPITGRTPESLQEFTEAIDQTKKNIYKAYDDLATQAGENGVKIDTIKIANELDQVINNKAIKLSNPEAVKYAEEVRNRFIKAGELDAKTAQDIIQNYNNSLKAFYRNPTPEGLTKNAVDALMANQMRQALDDGIEGLTGAQYQTLKTQYGALKTIERDVLRATLRDSRKNTKGLIDYTDIFSGGQLVSGLLTMNLGMIATGAAQKGMAEWFKYLNNPNRAIKQMFESTAKLDQPQGSVPIPTRKQLPTPEAGAADQSTYTPINLGERAQSTIDAGERTNPKIKAPNVTEVKPTVTEQAMGNRQIATEELKASMMGAEAGLKKTEEGYSRFTSFPDWIPSELRSKDLFGRVLKHVENNTFPKEASVRETELYTLLKSRVEQRAFELDSIANNNLNNAGKPMTWDDIPFGFVLAGGLGAYYYFNEDGSLAPLAVVGSLTPQGRKFAIKLLNESEDAILSKKSALIKGGMKESHSTIKQLDKGLDSISKQRNKLNGST